MYFSPDEDDDGFIPSKSSNLASLFGGDQNAGGQTSLMYTAPKQPKGQSPAPSSKESKSEPKLGQPAVVHATVVNAYKFENNQHVHQGKLGVAIIANHESHSCMLILYRGKQQTITKASISSKFTFTVQSNNYASFYDDQRISWSINFEGSQNAIEFAKQVAIAKVNTMIQPLDSLLTQDLLLGSGSSLDINDVANVKFTGWIFSNHTFGQIFDSNESANSYLKIKIGVGKTIKGLESGIIGMKTGSQRLIIIPPSLGYGAQGVDSKVPANATLILQVNLKQDGESFSSTSTSVITESDVKKTTPLLLPFESEVEGNNLKEESIIKTRGASISEQLQHPSPKKDKAKIISRMAKVGQPMLPLTGAITAQMPSSESETEEESRSRSSPSPELLPKPLPRTHPHIKAVPAINPQIVDTTPVVMPFQGGIVSGRSLSVFHSQAPSMTYPISSQTSYTMLPGQPYINPPSGGDAHMPVLLSEVRAQNTELRLHVGQVAEKVEKVLGKLEQTATIYPTMEAGMLAQNIQRIIQENEKLKGEIKEKNQKIEALTEKITELLQRNQKFLEQSNSMLEQRSDFLQTSSVQTQARLASLEQEKSHLLLKLQETDKIRGGYEAITSNNEALQASLELAKQGLAKMEERLSEELSKSNHFMKNIEDLEGECKLLRSKTASRDDTITKELGTWKIKCEHMEKSLADLQLQLQEARNNKTSETVTFQPNLVDEIKKIMNATYRSLQKQFEVEKSYTGGSIKETLAATIRSVTLELMDHFGDLEKSSYEVDPHTSEPTASVASESSRQNVEKEAELSPLSKNVEARETNKAAPTKEPQSAQLDDDSSVWKPQPPPLFDEAEGNSETEDDWLP